MTAQGMTCVDCIAMKDKRRSVPNPYESRTLPNITKAPNYKNRSPTGDRIATTFTSHIQFIKGKGELQKEQKLPLVQQHSRDVVGGEMTKLHNKLDRSALVGILIDGPHHLIELFNARRPETLQSFLGEKLQTTDLPQVSQKRTVGSAHNVSVIVAKDFTGDGRWPPRPVLVMNLHELLGNFGR